jgi:hypothetical protein
MTTKFTRDRGFTRARRMGSDDERAEARAAIQELIDDPDADFGDLLACAIQFAPEDQQEEVHQALRDMGLDAGGPRKWARDRLEMRQHRRLGRDFGPESLTGGGSGPEQFSSERDRKWEEGEDRRPRRGAMDRMAMDARTRREAAFDAWFPGAARIEKF